jgi:hypothetical protein
MEMREDDGADLGWVNAQQRQALGRPAQHGPFALFRRLRVEARVHQRRLVAAARQPNK